MRKKLLTTVVTAGVMGICLITTPMGVEAASSVSVETANGNYSTMGFGGSFQEMDAKVREHLAEGHNKPFF